MTERTYIMIKPDGVQRGLVGIIINRFEAKGYYLRALKFRQPTKELLEEHYGDLKERPFFPALVGYMNSGPVVCMVWEGAGVVATGRHICHGSDSVANAEKEIALWFDKEEVLAWKH